MWEHLVIWNIIDPMMNAEPGRRYQRCPAPDGPVKRMGVVLVDPHSGGKRVGGEIARVLPSEDPEPADLRQQRLIDCLVKSQFELQFSDPVKLLE